MSFLPPLLSRDQVERKFNCLGCGLRVTMDQEACDHCSRKISENDKLQMQSDYDENALKVLPKVLVVLAIMILFVFLVRSTI